MGQITSKDYANESPIAGGQASSAAVGPSTNSNTTTTNKEQCNGRSQLQPPSHVPVLIIGGGPIGLLAGILLAKRGFTSVILERHAKRLGQPKAHAINPRSLEILRQAGLDTAHLRNLGASAQDADAVRFVLSMKGLEVGSLPYERQDEAVRELTPEPLFNIAQPILEQYLYDLAVGTGSITIWKEWQWQSCTELENKTISSTVRDKQTDRDITVRSKYLLGCDGAHARSRIAFEIPFDSLDGRPPTPIHYVSVNFNADLSKEKTGMLWFIMTKTAGKRNFIAYDRASNWVFVTTYNPHQTSGGIFTEDYCRSLIDQSIGEKVDYKVLGITLWNTTPRIAKHYRSKKIHNGLLAGDAAHCFPSTGGLGINTGIGDVHNLVWKIHAVENGLAKDSLIDTYQVERIPIAVNNSRQSHVNEANIHTLGRAVFGTSDKTVKERLDCPAMRKEIDEALNKNIDHFDSLDLQIGYVYGQQRPVTKSVREFKSQLVPGGRLPHAWIKYGGQEVSTLDVVDGFNFVLFTSRGFVKDRVLSLGKVNVRVVEVGEEVVDEVGQWSRIMGLDGHSAVLVRPDQHILTSVQSAEEMWSFLRGYLES